MRDIVYTSQRLVTRHQGALPAIISCPHGGDERPDDIAERTGDGLPPECKFKIETSLRTEEARRAALVEDLAFAMSHLIARYADTPTMAAFRSAAFLPQLRRGAG